MAKSAARGMRTLPFLAAVGASVACRFPYPADVADDDVAEVDAGAGCQADAECDSDFCDHGACAPAAQVLFVRPDGADGGNSCTDRASPCKTLSHALVNVPQTNGNPDANRRFIKLMTIGSYLESDTVAIEARTVVIFGAQPSLPPSVNRSVLDRTGNGRTLEIVGADVRLERVAISNGSGAGAHGVDCRSDAEDAQFVGDGIEVSSNSGIGIVTNACDITIKNSILARNAAGGMTIQSGRAVVINNVIVGNGGVTSSSFGGLLLEPSVSATSVVQSNVIVDNRAIESESDGVTCWVPGLTLVNNIVRGEPARARVSGSCAFDHTLYGPDDPGGRLGTANGNMLVANGADMQFVDPAFDDYHIKAGSVAKGKGTTMGLAPEAMTDMDGQQRPQGAPDVGADEIPD